MASTSSPTSSASSSTTSTKSTSKSTTTATAATTTTTSSSGRAILGSLTTTFTPPAACSIYVAACNTCDTAYWGQTCATGGAADVTSCWPTTSAGLAARGYPLLGWGFYSPGLICPSGYSTACSATAGGSTGWDMEYSLVAGETAYGCCPKGFSCTNNGWQTCVAFPTTTIIPTVTCDDGTSNGFGYKTVASQTTTDFHMLAPMIQINFQQTDVTSSTKKTTTKTSTAATGSTTSVSDTATTGPAITGSATPTTSPAATGLSGGAIAGVVVGVVAGVALIAIAGWLFVQRRRRRPAGTGLGVPELPTKEAVRPGELDGVDTGVHEAVAPGGGGNEGHVATSLLVELDATPASGAAKRDV